MNIWTKTVYGIKAFLKAFQDPKAESDSLSIGDRMTAIQVAWLYHSNKMFEKSVADWTNYLNERGLYKHTKLVFNPARQINSFYIDNIWQNSANEDYEGLITPVSPFTDEGILKAIEQLDQWSNFQSEKQIIKQYASATGSVLIELVDDTNREKVLHNTVWAAYVKEIVLNNTGDVQSYVLEFNDTDLDGKQFLFRKDVNKEQARYYKDDKPFAYDFIGTDTLELPYGFTPAVWIKHNDIGANFGVPACQHFDKINHVNSLASHLHDNIHKEIESAKIVATSGEIVPMENKTTMDKDGSLNLPDPRLERAVLKTNDANAKILDFSGLLKLSEAHPYLQDLINSFTDDYPELQAEAIIKQNSQISGAALERLLTPAQNRLDGVQPNYNQQLIKLRQMGIAVAGYRTSNGWNENTKQQQVFNKFNLNSYAKGELDFSIVPAKLISETESDREDLLIKKAQRAVTLKDFVTNEEALMIAGYSQDESSDILLKIEQEFNRREVGLPDNPELLPNKEVIALGE